MSLSPFERAIKTGLKVTRQTQGVPVTYRRNSTNIKIKHALQGRTDKQTIDVGGEEQVIETQDWYIAVEDIASLGNPQRGDLIIRKLDGVTYTFSVECRMLGETEWDWSDNAKSQFVIHTRKDGAYEVSQPTGFDLSGNELLP
jgi:hypothetical protein